MAETLGDFLSRKLNEADSDSVTETGAVNSEAAAEIYGSGAVNLDGRRILGDDTLSDLGDEEKEILNDYAEELTAQNNTNSPDRPVEFGQQRYPQGPVKTTEFLYSQDKGGAVDAVLAAAFHNTTDTHIAFPEDTLKATKGDLLPGQKNSAAQAAGWVRNSGIRSNKAHGNEFFNPLVVTPVEVPDNTRPVEQAVFNALAANNRFSPSNESPYIAGGQHTNGLYSFQSGIHSEEPQTSTSRYDPNARAVTLDDMRKIADDILLAAVGHPVGRDVNIDDLGKDVFGEFATDLAFNASNVQLAAERVKGHQLEAGTSEAAIALGLRTRQNDDFLTGDGTYKADLNKHSGPGSFGVLSSPAEPFSAPLALGMIWPTIYLLLLLLIFSLLMELLMALIPSFKEFAESQEPLIAFEPHFMTKGEYGRRQNFFIRLLYRIAGLNRLDHFFLTDMSKGIQVFFGLPKELKELKDPEALFESALNLVQSSGYYLVVMRSAIRDFDQVQEAFSSFGGAGIFAGVNQIFEILESFTSSTSWRFFVRLTELGDIWYKSRTPQARSSEQRMVDRLDVLTGENRQTSTRYSNTARGQKTISTLSMHSFPAALLAGQHLGHFSDAKTREVAETSGQGTADEVDRLNKNAKKVSYFYKARSITELKRLPNNLVQQLETVLDSEYVPFYFHDVRTNEVIALPAFITNFSDNFNINYNSTQGMGRTDPVRIYNNTERTVDFSFKLVAMNETDHEYMYMVINKLITMIYPQRSRGRIRTSSFTGVRFIQPFSQNITASPLVRIRLGELLHSNYSIDSFARMLGYPGELDASADRNKSFVEHAQDAALKRGLPIRLKMATEIFNDRIMDEVNNISVGESVSYRMMIKAGTKVTMYQANVTETARGGFGTMANLLGDTGGTDEPPKPITFVLPKPVFGTGLISRYAPTDSDGDGKPDEEQPAFVRTRGQPALVQFFSEEFRADHPNLRYGKFGLEVFKFVQKAAEGSLAARMKRAEIFFDFDPAAVRVKPDRNTLKQIMEKDLKLTSAGLDVFNKESATDKPHNGNISVISQDLTFIRESPVYKAFTSTKGAGLAGFITSFNIEYGEATWNTTKGSRAPMTAEISIGFAPVHDMTIGLDQTGRMIAPTYPVGRTAHSDIRKLDPDVADLLNDKVLHATNLTGEESELGAGVEVPPPKNDQPAADPNNPD